MDRRGFLRLLGLSAATLAVDPASLLWTPTKTIFLPPAGGWTGGNTFVTPDWLTREALRHLTNNLRFVESFNREYDMAYAVPDRRHIRLVA